MGWKENCNVTLRSFSRCHIDVLIVEERVSHVW